MLASAIEMPGNGQQQQQQQCVVCGANGRQYDGKCSSCGEGDAQMLDRPDQHPHHHEEDAAAASDEDINSRRQNNWYDKHRQCHDGSVHFGELELITWGGEEAGWELGWGRAQLSEVEFMKKQYKHEFGGDDEKLYEYWPQGFRWTCCGTTGDMAYGCDHHGTGPQPCGCDYCGKLPERQGLHLSRGPDPRSHGFHAMMSMPNFNNYELAM
ncbi:hypothetical protein PG991_001079 [Apiospora marii]|uniref:Uncharacterized protein n=1 Tax=Apiospora marii TaxID=335849 RepID=A0ABR1STR8_9PEZI